MRQEQRIRFFATRLLTVPSFLRGGLWRLPSVLIFIASFLLMAVLTRCQTGWPFYQLADPGKETLGQQRAWLFFIVVQTISIIIGMMRELVKPREPIVPQEPPAHQYPQALSIKSERKNVLIPLSEILYIESKDNYIFLTLADGRQLKTLATLTSTIAQLPPDQFVRIHKSFVVARKRIASFSRRQVFVEGASKPLPVSRTYAEAVRQL